MMTRISYDIRTNSGVRRINQCVDLDELFNKTIHVEDMGDHWHVSLGQSALVCAVRKRDQRVTVVEESSLVRR